MVGREELARLENDRGEPDSPIALIHHPGAGESTFAATMAAAAAAIAKAAGDKVVIEHGDGATVPVTPCLTLICPGGGSINYAAAPEGLEARPFIDALLDLAVAGACPSGELAVQLAALEDPTELLVFIGPTCPHCPQAVAAANELAIASPKITATIIDALEFTELAARFAVKSVPVTTINRGLTLTGVIPAVQLAGHVLAQGTEEYDGRVFRSLVESGRFPAAATRLRAARGWELFVAAWNTSSTSTRMGLMLAAEEVLGQDAASLDGAVPGLIALLAAEDAALRGDSADLLGKIGHPSAAPALEGAVHDPNPDVAEIAIEALEEVRRRPC